MEVVCTGNATGLHQVKHGDYVLAAFQDAGTDTFEVDLFDGGSGSLKFSCAATVTGKVQLQFASSIRASL